MVNTKKAVIAEIAKELNVTKTYATEVYNTVTETMRKTLLDCGEYALPGFGTIKVVKREARQARNPRTNEVVDVPAKKTVVLKASVSLKEAVN